MVASRRPPPRADSTPAPRQSPTPADERLINTCEVWGSFDGADMTGITAYREGWIDQLYVLPQAQGRGCGTALLQLAQNAFGSVHPWTFQRNIRARRFYEARAFPLVHETDGATNQEKEPDVLYFWARTEA
jgi:GNAT superfamily N-acetyltransferase